MSGIGHNGLAVVQGSYADFKIIKTRSVFQAIVEFPIEEAEAFINAFGIPIPGQERPVAVALIQPPAPAPVSRETRREAGAATAAVDTHHPKNTAASERFRALGKPEQMVSRCAMLCADHGFQNWLGVDGAEDAARKVRLKCRVNSRSELASSPEAQRIWEQMMTDYDLWANRLPERRG